MRTGGLTSAFAIFASNMHGDRQAVVEALYQAFDAGTEPRKSSSRSSSAAFRSPKPWPNKSRRSGHGPKPAPKTPPPPLNAPPASRARSCSTRRTTEGERRLEEKKDHPIAGGLFLAIGGGSVRTGRKESGVRSASGHGGDNSADDHGGASGHWTSAPTPTESAVGRKPGRRSDESPGMWATKIQSGTRLQDCCILATETR